MPLLFQFLMISLLLISLIIMFIDISFQRKLKKDLQRLLCRERTSLANLKDQIVILLVRQRTEMKISEIAHYLDYPIQVVQSKIIELEAEEMVSHHGERCWLNLK